MADMIETDEKQETGAPKLQKRKKKVVKKMNPEVLAKHAELNFTPKVGSEEYSQQLSKMDPKQKEELLIASKKGKSMSNDPESKQIPPTEDIITDEEVDAEEAQMDKEELPDLKPEDRVKEGAFGMTNFKTAFKFFGPRMAAMLIGGDRAMEYTGDLMTEFQQAQPGSEMSDYQRIRLAQAQKRQEQQASAEKAKQGRFEKAYGLNVRKFERPGGKIMLEQAAQKTLMKHLDALDKLAGAVDPDHRGPIAGLGKDWAVKFGLSNDKDWAAFSARSNMVLNSYIKAITGAQSGAEEQARLGKDVPSPRDNPIVFSAKSKMMRDAVTGRLESVNSELEKYGYKADDGSFSGKGLTKEMRRANAEIVSRVIREELKSIEEKHKDKKGTKTAESKVPVGRKYMKGGKKYIMTEQGPKEL